MFTFPISLFSSSGSIVTINFDSLGGNDIFYYIGTSSLNTSWSNPYSNGLINITASNFDASADNISSLTDRQPSNYYPGNYSNNWIRFDFITKKIQPNYYVLRGRSYDNNVLPRNWKLQGSNDTTNWTDLDTRTNNSSITGANVMAGFSCTTSTSYRYLRILSTGTDSSGLYYLALGEVYIYGDIIG